MLREPALAQALECDLRSARETLDALDRDALAAVGVGTDLDVPAIPMREPVDRPRKPTVKAILQDRLPLTPAAKTALRESSRDMRRGRHIAPQQVLSELLGLKPPDPAAELFAALGVDRAAVRERLAAGY